jgi:hypothetical protein
MKKGWKKEANERRGKGCKGEMMEVFFNRGFL